MTTKSDPKTKQVATTSKIDQDEINKAVWNACDTFRGTVDPSIYKDFILTMLFLKYLSDVYKDKEQELKEQFPDKPDFVAALLEEQPFILPKGASFWDLYEQRNLAGNGERIDTALQALEENNGTKLKNVFQDISFNTDKLGQEKQKNEILCHLLEDFGKDILDLSPSRIGSLDIIGNAYEYLIKHFAAGSGKSAGEFYTPPEVSDLLAALLDPQPGESICDPACGSGSLLLKCAARVKKHSPEAACELFGQEAIGATWSLAKMNMFLHGADNHIIEWGDTIRHPMLLENDGQQLKCFDVVTANPPFSLDKWGHDNAADDPFGRFKRGIPPKTKGDYAFISHMIATLKTNGRMGVVVPHGVLFRASTEGKIRKALIDEGKLQAVIGLPEKLFFGTGIPAAILIFKNLPANATDNEKDDKVLFIDASREFQAGKNQNQLTTDNISKILSTYLARQNVDKYAYLATLAEIQENDYNLNIPRYVDTFEEEAEIDLTAVRKERIELKKELTELETEMAGFLKELGYGA